MLEVITEAFSEIGYNLTYEVLEAVDFGVPQKRQRILIVGYKKNIKPAPNPYYLLEKFYGNLSIQEYRKLLNSAHMLLTIDKPMTRILPELHEDNEEFILNIYGGSSAQTAQSGGMYKVKRQSEKQQGPTKTSIIRNNFGLAN
jgi:site-specific DNA-cytosine methylase